MTQIHDLIQSIQGPEVSRKNVLKQPEGSPGTETKSFGDTMSEFLNVVNSNSIEAGQAVTDVIQGKSDSLAEAMISMEESKMSFQLMIEIRTKLLESYQEISRMQV